MATRKYKKNCKRGKTKSGRCKRKPGRPKSKRCKRGQTKSGRCKRKPGRPKSKRSYKMRSSRSVQRRERRREHTPYSRPSAHSRLGQRSQTESVREPLDRTAVQQQLGGALSRERNLAKQLEELKRLYNEQVSINQQNEMMIESLMLDVAENTSVSPEKMSVYDFFKKKIEEINNIPITDRTQKDKILLEFTRQGMEKKLSILLSKIGTDMSQNFREVHGLTKSDFPRDIHKILQENPLGKTYSTTVYDDNEENYELFINSLQDVMPLSSNLVRFNF